MTVMSAGQTALSKASKGSLGAYPSFGMSMRFAVTVATLGSTPGTPSDGVYLGLWQSCKGLQVEMNYKRIESGGNYTQMTPLPERIAWAQITLERAVEKSSSLAVWNWLNTCINGWGKAPSTAGGFPSPTFMTITLLDYQLDGVLTWSLAGVRPVKWAGPSLSATENKVAIEQLVLEHQGFTCSAAD
jgi:phage tail-like protein